jgi:lysyl-tRNA synthetase, class II
VRNSTVWVIAGTLRGVAEENIPELVRVRLGKRERLLESGTEPYPVGFGRTATAAELRAGYGHLPPDTFTGEVVSVAGRVMLSRLGGKLCFALLRDGTGDIQVMISLAAVGEDRLAAWKRDVDLGDHVGVTGEVITSRSGELSVLASSWALTAKSLRPLPEKFRGLADPELRVRQRYVDLIVNPEARRSVELRAAVMRSIRSQLNEHGFLEVETPVLTPLHGGANARPFVTHSNAYDSGVYLRIALELYLKRLVVGGIERVYEIGRIFRNEGADATHNPEFTMLEAYEAYGDYNTIGELTQELVQGAAVAAFGSTVIRRADGSEYDIGGDWPKVTVYDAISATAGEQVTADTTEAELRKLCGRLEVPVARGWNRGQIVLEIYERLVEKRTVQPTFYRDFPVEVSPLVRQHRSDPRVAERWDLVAFGAELGTGVLRAGRSGGGACPVDRAVAAQGTRRPGGDGARRGLPARPGVRHAPDRGNGHGHRPLADDAHRREHPRDDPVPLRPSWVVQADSRPLPSADRMRPGPGLEASLHWASPR